MNEVEADRDFLFGTVALRLGLIGPEALATARSACLRDGGRSLEQALIEQGALTRAAAEAVRAELDRLRVAHPGGPGPLLAALAPGVPPMSAGPQTPATLQDISTLADGPTSEDSEGLYATRPLTAGPGTVEAASPEVEAGATLASGAPAVAAPPPPEPELLATQPATVPPAVAREAPPARADGADPGGTRVHEPGRPAPADLDSTRPFEPGGGEDLSTRPLTAGPTTAPFAADGPKRSGAAGPMGLPGDGASALSRYKILRPHAKGGLGEVFVALDQELSREVALKEIKGRHADDPHSRYRFVLEAEVTGGLEHPGIVPVYGLGQYPDGRPYYAMRFIRGETLQDAIVRFHEADKTPDRDPGERILAFRTLLTQFVDVCNAIAYAHSRGVIHRDLKPSNVMLGAFGETLVVDWGLAKALGQTEGPAGPSAPGPLRPLSGTGHSETLFGSTIGTPHYMSPEQAEGRLDLLGPPTDIYSLGATLYYLLTGVTPFRDKTLAAVLHKVKSGDFPPPREANATVPPALDAVCRKAMALRPVDRYGSARALAEEVEHWLGDEPVAAYPEPWPARLARWARRHKTFVGSAAALLVTGVIGLTIGTVLIKQEQRRTAAQRDRAEANLATARRSIRTVPEELGKVALVDVPQMESVRKRMLEQALAFYLTLLKDQPDVPALRLDTARAYLERADVQELLGDYLGAEPAYREAIARLSDLLAAAVHPADRDVLRGDLARAYHQYGILLKKSNRFEESERALSEALRLRKARTKAAPGRADLKEEATETLYQLGTLYHRLAGKGELTRAAYDEAVAEQKAKADAEPDQPGSRRKLAKYLNNLGMLLASLRPAEAEEDFARATALDEALVKASPTVAGYQWDLARSRTNLGTAHEARARAARAAGDSGAALAAYRAALEAYAAAQELFRKLAAEYPAVPDYRSELAAVSLNAGTVRLRLQQVDGVADLDAAVALLADLARTFDRRPDYRLYLAEGQRKRGIAQAQRDRLDEAAVSFAAARDVLTRLVADFPGVPSYQSALARALEASARILVNRGSDRAALREINAALSWDSAALKGSPGSLTYLEAQGNHTAFLARILCRMNDHAGAAAVAERLPKLLPARFDSWSSAARLLAQCVGAAGSEKDPGRRRALQDRYAARAVEMLREAEARGLRNPRELDDPDYAPLKGRPEFEKFRGAFTERTRSEA